MRRRGQVSHLPRFANGDTAIREVLRVARDQREVVCDGGCRDLVLRDDARCGIQLALAVRHPGSAIECDTDRMPVVWQPGDRLRGGADVGIGRCLRQILAEPVETIQHFV
jgi:hypothetical protein